LEAEAARSTTSTDLSVAGATLVSLYQISDAATRNKNEDSDGDSDEHVTECHAVNVYDESSNNSASKVASASPAGIMSTTEEMKTEGALSDDCNSYEKEQNLAQEESSSPSSSSSSLGAHLDMINAMRADELKECLKDDKQVGAVAKKRH
jgi:hypothetical protein